MFALSLPIIVKYLHKQRQKKILYCAGMLPVIPYFVAETITNQKKILINLKNDCLQGEQSYFCGK